MPKLVPDLHPGEIYGDWTVVSEVPGKREKHYTCRCSCGNTKVVTKSNLRLGKSKSCGKGSCKSLAVTHGLTKHPLYSVWCGIKGRLANPVGANACYKGISLCHEWTEFQSFYDWAISNGYAEGLTIDRKDRNGDYTPNNCRWVGYITQSQNRSKISENKAYKGVYQSKPRSGKVLYENTGKKPFYWIVIYNGDRHQRWGFESAEAAYQDRCKFIKDNFDGLVIPD